MSILVFIFFSTIALECLCTLYKYILSTRNCVVIFTCWSKKYKSILQKLSIMIVFKTMQRTNVSHLPETNLNFVIMLFHCSHITKYNKWSENGLSEIKIRITWSQIRTWSEKSTAGSVGKYMWESWNLSSSFASDLLRGWQGFFRPTTRKVKK